MQILCCEFDRMYCWLDHLALCYVAAIWLLAHMGGRDVCMSHTYSMTCPMFRVVCSMCVLMLQQFVCACGTSSCSGPCLVCRVACAFNIQLDALRDNSCSAAKARVPPRCIANQFLVHHHYISDGSPRNCSAVNVGEAEGHGGTDLWMRYVTFSCIPFSI